MDKSISFWDEKGCMVMVPCSLLYWIINSIKSNLSIIVQVGGVISVQAYDLRYKRLRS